MNGASYLEHGAYVDTPDLMRSVGYADVDAIPQVLEFQLWPGKCYGSVGV